MDLAFSEIKAHHFGAVLFVDQGRTIGFQAILDHRIRKHQETRSIFADGVLTVVVSDDGARVSVLLLSTDFFHRSFVNSLQPGGQLVVANGSVEGNDVVGLTQEYAFEAVEVHLLLQAFVGEREPLRSDTRLSALGLVTVEFR